MIVERNGNELNLLGIHKDDAILYLSMLEDRHAELSNMLQDKNKTPEDKLAWKNEKKVVWDHHKAIEAETIKLI